MDPWVDIVKHTRIFQTLTNQNTTVLILLTNQNSALLFVGEQNTDSPTEDSDSWPWSTIASSRLVIPGAILLRPRADTECGVIVVKTVLQLQVMFDQSEHSIKNIDQSDLGNKNINQSGLRMFFIDQTEQTITNTDQW